MKSHVKQKKEEKKDLEFPVLAKSKEGGNIVLFTTPTEGMVLVQGESPWPLGTYCTDWAYFTNPDVWTLLDKPIDITFEP